MGTRSIQHHRSAASQFCLLVVVTCPLAVACLVILRHGYILRCLYAVKLAQQAIVGDHFVLRIIVQYSFRSLTSNSPSTRTLIHFAIISLRILDEELSRVDSNTTLLQPLPHLHSLFGLPPCQSRTSMNPEAEDPWFVPSSTLLRYQCRVDLEEDVVERSTEICTVYLSVP